MTYQHIFARVYHYHRFTGSRPLKRRVESIDLHTNVSREDEEIIIGKSTALVGVNELRDGDTIGLILLQDLQGLGVVRDLNVGEARHFERKKRRSGAIKGMENNGEKGQK